MINCWLVSWGKTESNMGMDIKTDSSLPVINYVISFHVQDLSLLIILSNIMASFLFSSNENIEDYLSILLWIQRKTDIESRYLFLDRITNPILPLCISHLNHHEQRNLLVGIIIPLYYNPVPCMLPCSQHTAPLAKATAETSRLYRTHT